MHPLPTRKKIPAYAKVGTKIGTEITKFFGCLMFGKTVFENRSKNYEVSSNGANFANAILKILEKF